MVLVLTASYICIHMTRYAYKKGCIAVHCNALCYIEMTCIALIALDAPNEQRHPSMCKYVPTEKHACTHTYVHNNTHKRRTRAHSCTHTCAHVMAHVLAHGPSSRLNRFQGQRFAFQDYLNKPAGWMDGSKVLRSSSHARAPGRLSEDPK